MIGKLFEILGYLTSITVCIVAIFLKEIGIFEYIDMITALNCAILIHLVNKK